MFECVFVYGTLKTRQCREKCWPVLPHSVDRAWTQGKLYDIGPYPALVHGEDRILGEVWSFPKAEIEKVFTALDRIEGTNQPGQTNEYDRVTVVVHLESGRQLLASSYFYARHEILERLAPQRPSLQLDGHQYVVWPSDATP